MCGDGCTKPCHQENKTCYFNVEVLRHDLNGAKAFSKIDLTNGFHQLELDEESKGIPTFSTHVELRHYFRVLNFGTYSAPEFFHEEFRKKL